MRIRHLCALESKMTTGDRRRIHKNFDAAEVSSAALLDFLLYAKPSFVANVVTIESTFEGVTMVLDPESAPSN